MDERGQQLLIAKFAQHLIARIPAQLGREDRQAMVSGMVDRLATRLKQNGDDVEGWLRLMRAYMVMGERDKAASALTDARQAVAADAERLRQLNEGAKNLGLDG